jgi:hypothetical protein
MYEAGFVEHVCFTKMVTFLISKNMVSEGPTTRTQQEAIGTYGWCQKDRKEKLGFVLLSGERRIQLVLTQKAKIGFYV